MASDQGRERILGVALTPGEEPLQQLGVGPAAHRAEGVERPDVPEDAAGRSPVHRNGPPRFAVRTLYSG